MMEKAQRSFLDAWGNCCERFMSDGTHNKGISPLINGPCDDCSDEAIKALLKDSNV